MALSQIGNDVQLKCSTMHIMTMQQGAMQHNLLWLCRTPGGSRAGSTPTWQRRQAAELWLFRLMVNPRADQASELKHHAAHQLRRLSP